MASFEMRFTASIASSLSSSLNRYIFFRFFLCWIEFLITPFEVVIVVETWKERAKRMFRLSWILSFSFSLLLRSYYSNSFPILNLYYVISERSSSTTLNIIYFTVYSTVVVVFMMGPLTTVQNCILYFLFFWITTEKLKLKTETGWNNESW